MTQNDLYIAQAYGVVVLDENGKSSIAFSYDADIFKGIDSPDKGPDGTPNDLRTFSGSQYNIYQFSIQTAPGVEIILNENSSNVKVGQTGIWEINLSSLTPICSVVGIKGLDRMLGVSTINGKDSGLGKYETQYQTYPELSDYQPKDTYDVSCAYCLIDVIYSINQDGGVEG